MGHLLVLVLRLMVVISQVGIGDNTGIIIKTIWNKFYKVAGSFDDINSGTHQSANTVEYNN